MAKGEYYQISTLNMAEEMPIKLWETYDDSDLKSEFVDTTGGIMPGAEKYINCFMAKHTGELKTGVLLHGPAYVSLVCNRNGAILPQGSVAKWYRKDFATTSDGAINTLISTSANFVADEEIGNFVFTGGGTTYKPQTRQIVKNTATILTVQPNLEEVVPGSRNAYIFSSSQVIMAGVGEDRHEIAGVVLAPNGIPDNYWGWVCSWGRVSALVASSEHLAEHISIVTDSNGCVKQSSSDEYYNCIGVGVVSTIGFTDTYLAPVFIDVRSKLGEM
jgi:hypothetical protein